MASRPKRQCFLDAIAAIGIEAEEDSDDIFDDASPGDNVTDAESVDDVPPDDEILEEELLIEVDNSDAPSDSESDNEPITDHDEPAYVSANGTQWRDRSPVAHGRAPARNIINFRKGPAPGIQPSTEKEALLIFLSDLIDEMVLFSNLQGRRIVASWNQINPSK